MQVDDLQMEGGVIDIAKAIYRMLQGNLQDIIDIVKAIYRVL